MVCIERGRDEEEMRRLIVIGLVLALVSVVFVAVPMNVGAATVDQITPSKGKVGKTAVIHGSELKGGTVVVKFGKSVAQDVTVLNDRTVKVTVPNRDALDPNPVKVTVTVDGVPAMGDLEFYYDPPGPEPLITGFDPTEVMVGIPFSVMIVGTDFMTPQGRVPDQVFLFGPGIVMGWVVGGVTATGFVAEFPAVAFAGYYLIVVGFSDGSGASAEGFLVT